MLPSPILTHFEARKALDALRAGAASVTLSLDLGVSHVEIPSGELSGPANSQARISLTGSGLTVNGVIVSTAALEKIASEERKCFEILENGEVRPVSVFSDVTGWVRTLCPTAEAPTTIVAGFPMHRIKDTTPLADSRAKVRALGRPHGQTLDTATGLGYTAIELAKTATEVVTVELDPAAIDLARRNPWSRELFTRRNIRLITGDVYQAVDAFAEGEFAAILHDPPTVQLAGELYSGVFYRKLFRILRRGGRLFHYIGDPESAMGARTAHGVAGRLREAGFKDVKRNVRAFGITAAV